MNSSGDPARLMLPPEATDEEVNIMRHELGLDKPLPVRYVTFIVGSMHGDFEDSLYWRGREAVSVVIERFPATIQLSLTALLWSTVLSLILGIISAKKRGSLIDKCITSFSLLGQTAPSFWVGIMLILFFSVKLHGLLPPSGSGGIEYLILPAFVLGLHPLARNTRFVRSCMLEVLSQDYIITARAKGLGQRAIVLKHALRNAAIPLVTVIGLELPSVLGGATIIETIFAWPGVGRLLIQAIGMRDFPVVQCTIFFIALSFVVVNIVIDILYSVLDPRVKAEYNS